MTQPGDRLGLAEMLFQHRGFSMTWQLLTLQLQPAQRFRSVNTVLDGEWAGRS
jgi:hypothetical protein